ncbi:DUF764 family protein (plasmid) [Borrelia miyamotoi]|uniref:DUF764 family protein n=5 Tax=Borrelia miyamotoi TaxID=47466 RepID=A0A481YGN4_9SPIR|nr:DUF764 family protein [Borrelia miyamotoi]AHH05697.1 Putative cytosolic protein [Borrelia miyamotoi FR64b]QBK63988.1 DUF764 family protein [Borrelia miyamotoi]QBK65264.1 DUF764 family protein [Borrelia miyamotoi]QBK66513.1 DUF764 family protein [Borrelia miyamotoi]QBL99440.1 DUF764 family protein [Borrelia miyamotoi]
MILDIYTLQKYIISILQKFKEVAHEFDIQIINTYNHPYISKLTVEKCNILVIKFDNVDDLFKHNMRTGAFYDNVNELGIFFTLYFICFTQNDTDKNAYTRVLEIYSHFSDFLYNGDTHKFSIDADEYTTLINIYIYSTSNLNQSGFLKLNSNHESLAYCASSLFKANIQIIETPTKDKGHLKER